MSRPFTLKELRDEIVIDPLNRRYAEMDDVQVAASLSEHADREVLRPVTIPDLLTWMAENAGIEALETGAGGGPRQQRAICKAALQLLNNVHVPSINFGNPKLMQMLDALVAYGIFTADQKTSLLAYGLRAASRSQELWDRAITPSEVADARRLS